MDIMGASMGAHRLIIDRVVVASKIYVGVGNGKSTINRDGADVTTSQCIKLEQSGDYYGITKMTRGVDYLTYKARSLINDMYSIELTMRKKYIPAKDYKVVTGYDATPGVDPASAITYEVTEYPTLQVLESGYIDPILRKWFKPIGGFISHELDEIDNFFKVD